MRIEEIERQEQSFNETALDADGRRYVLLRKAIEIPGEAGEMRFVDVKPAGGDESYFVHTMHPKEQIVVHFTVGHLKGDVATLTTPGYRVSVPFLIARDGTIYNLFASRYWSYHLGPDAVGGNRDRSRASVAIELSNMGPLKREGNQLLTSYTTPDRKDVYCEMDQAGAYVEAPFRDEKYFATFTDAQYLSLITLIRYLTARYDIPRAFLPPPRRYETDAETSQFRGVLTHVNFRRHDKWDIGPAFEWERVVAEVGA